MAAIHPQLNIVLIEDHDVLRQMLQQALEEAGHHVAALSCAEELEDEAGGRPADVFLVDLNLPGEDGLSLTRRIRQAYPVAGIIIITARSGVQDKVDGYAQGADLYLSKPVEVAELCAAVAAMGQRGHRVSQLVMQAKAEGFILDEQQIRIGRPGQPGTVLTAPETSLLAAFSRAPGQRLAYWQLAETLGLDLESYAKASLEVRIVRLRKKLVEAGAESHCIASVRGQGYQLCMTVQVV